MFTTHEKTYSMFGESNPRVKNQSGEGISQDVVNAFSSLVRGYSTETANKIRNAIPDSDANARPAFVGENHAILQLPNGKLGMANFMGPNTKVIERLKRGDNPRTESDKVAMRHDIDYTLASNQPTRELQIQKIREADNRMIKKIGEVRDTMANKQLGKKLIQGKVLGENLGVLSKEKFAGPLRKLSEADENMLLSARDKLEQEGFGINTPEMNRAEKPVGVGSSLKKRLLQMERRRKGKLPVGMSVTRDYPDSKPYQAVNFGGKGIDSGVITDALKKLGIPKSVIPEKLLGNVLSMIKNKISSNTSLGNLIKSITKGVTPLLGMGYMKGRGLNPSNFTQLMKDKNKKNKLYKVVSKYVLNKVTGKQSGSGFWSDFVRGFRSVVDPFAKIASIIPTPIAPLARAYTMGTSVLDAVNKK